MRYRTAKYPLKLNESTQGSNILPVIRLASGMIDDGDMFQNPNRQDHVSRDPCLDSYMNINITQIFVHRVKLAFILFSSFDTLFTFPFACEHL